MVRGCQERGAQICCRLIVLKSNNKFTALINAAAMLGAMPFSTPCVQLLAAAS